MGNNYKLEGHLSAAVAENVARYLWNLPAPATVPTGNFMQNLLGDASFWQWINEARLPLGPDAAQNAQYLWNTVSKTTGAGTSSTDPRTAIDRWGMQQDYWGKQQGINASIAASFNGGVFSQEVVVE